MPYFSGNVYMNNLCEFCIFENVVILYEVRLKGKWYGTVSFGYCIKVFDL